MIQTTGTIKASNGVGIYVNPLINIYFASQNKVIKTMGVAQVVNENFEAIDQIGSYAYELSNPSFEAVQDLVKLDLEISFPDIVFTIV